MSNVLLVEDDSAIAEVTTTILRDAGFIVRSPSSIDELHEVLETELFSVILLDGWIWGHKGADICKKVKKSEKMKQSTVILLSAQPNAKKLAEEMGADDVLEKPFDIDSLISTVKRYI